MDKYIKTEDLLDAIYPVDPENDGSDGCTVVAAPLTLTSEELEAMLDKIPVADVAPVIHAKWIESKKTDNDGNIVCSCPRCNHNDRHSPGIVVPYCWFCGAKMDKDD